MRQVLLLLVGFLTLAGVAVASSGGATQAEPHWVITDLGTLGGQVSSASAINDHGEVVGSSETALKGKDGLGVEHVFLWKDGKMRDLGALGRRTNWSTAVAINNHGMAVGASMTGVVTSSQGFPDWHAVVWRGGRQTDIGWTDSDAPLHVNERGQVVVSARDGFAFLWQGGRRTDLGSLGGGGTWVEAINDRGQIVGESHVRSRSAFRAFLWQNGRMRRLAIPESKAWGLNDKGEVVGWTEVGHGRQHAVLWKGRTIRDLGSLRQSSYAYAINEREQVVGWSGVAPGVQHAFLWQKGRMIDLLPGKESSRAYAISQQGEVAVESRSSRWPFTSHALVWHGGQITKLPTLGESGVGDFLGDPSQDAMNNRHQIAGWAKTKNGNIHAVLWTKRGLLAEGIPRTPEASSQTDRACGGSTVVVRPVTGASPWVREIGVVEEAPASGRNASPASATAAPHLRCSSR